MIQIKQCIEYDSGSQVRDQVMYLAGSDPIILEGRVDFTAYGDVEMNGIKLHSARMAVELAKPTQFDIGDNSAILFHLVPRVAVEMPERIPVPDLPDQSDAMTLQMHMMFEDWAKSRGLIQDLPAEGEGESPSSLELDDDDLDLDQEDFDMDIPLDPSNLVDLEQHKENIKEPDGSKSNEDVGNVSEETRLESDLTESDSDSSEAGETAEGAK